MLLTQENFDCFDCEVRIDVSRSQIDNSKGGLASQDRQRAEVSIVGEHNAVFRDCTSKQIDVRRTEYAFLGHVQNVDSPTAQKLNHVYMNVLVGKQLELDEFQLLISAEVKTSFLTAWAA